MNDALDNYEILSIIGEGTFGVVKLGEVKSTGEKVAIKILEKKKMTSQDDKERVEREIEILNKINHINVIKIIKIIKDPEKIYIIMEFCENGELFNHIVEKQSLDEEEAAYYYYQLINGLECLHHYGIVHRDLKPENLLLSKKNILKIIDFGLSNYFNEIDLLSTPCGSPSYASPEMVSGNKYNGYLIDIWSSGIILFAMLCGFLPFEDQDNEILFKKIYECKVEFPNDISKDAIDLMKKIMVSNPKKRITLNEIKNHRFYLKGRKKFKKLHPRLIKEVEKNYEKKIEYMKEDPKNEENIRQIKNEKIKEKKNEKNKDFDSKDIIDFSVRKYLDNKNKNILDLNERKDKKNNKENKMNITIKDKDDNKNNNNNELNKNFYTKNSNNSKKNNNNYDLNIDKQDEKIKLNLNEYKIFTDNKDLLINDNLDMILNEINNDNKLNKVLDINKGHINALKNNNYNSNKIKGIIEQKLNKNLEKKENTNFKIINQDNNNDNLYNNIQSKNIKASINNNIKKNQIEQINSIVYKNIKRSEITDENNNKINNKMLNEKKSENHNINIINEDDNTSKIENQKNFKYNALDAKKFINRTLEFNNNKYITKTKKIDKKSINNNIYLSLEDNNNGNQILNSDIIYKSINTERLYLKKKKYIQEKLSQNINYLNSDNSRNISSNLKNKINIDKNTYTQKVEGAIKEKMTQKIEVPLTNIKNEMMNYRNIEYEQSWANKNIKKISNSMYNNRLSENENNYHKTNNMISTIKNIKLNNNSFLYSEKQNEKKKIANNSNNSQYIKGNNQRVCYKSENKMYISIRDNHLYSNLFNSNDKIISESNNIIQSKNLNQSKKNIKINYIKNNINYKINNQDIVSYSQRNTCANMNPKENVNLYSASQRKKLIKINLQNDKILGYNNKTFNQNINAYNIPNKYTSNNINNYQNSITLSPNNEVLLDDINYRRKFVTETFDFQSINTSKNQTNMKRLNLLDKRSQNIKKISDKYNYNNEKEFMNNYGHKKNVSNYNLFQENSMYNQNSGINMKVKTPKTDMTTIDFINSNFDEFDKEYNITSTKGNLKDRKLMKYTSNDIFNKNINLRLDNFSNSMENYKIKKYSQPSAINSLSNNNLNPTNQGINNMKNSPIASNRTNSTNNKNLKDNNTNIIRNNKNYKINEVKKINNTKYLKHKLIRKGIYLNTSNDNNMYNDNYFININDNKNNTQAKLLMKYSNNYKLNKTNEIENSQFNKTQINSKSINLNKKLDFNEIDINDNSLEDVFQNGYENKKNIKIHQKSEEKNKRNKNLFFQKNNRSIFQNNINNNIMNNYINIEIGQYNSKNPINIKNNNIINSNLNKKRQIESIKNTNDNSENLLIKVANSKSFKRHRTLGSESLNNKKIKQRERPLSFLSSYDLNEERSDYDLVNNISKSLINDFISKNINRYSHSNNSKSRLTMNLNSNYNYIINNNNYFNNS